MYKRRTPPTEPVRILFEGREIIAARGESLAAALLAAGVERFGESPLSGSPRAPFCMIGNCYECLLEIDGEAARQACLTRVREGMLVQRRARGLAGADRAAEGGDDEPQR